MAYASYTSDSEYSSESEGFESGSDHEDPRITREQDPRYQILRKPTSNTEIKNDLHKAPGAPWDSSSIPTSLENYVYSPPPKSTKTSLFSMKSLNRDKSIYPTPYNFQLKLPRVYKNVTKFQLVQLSFPNNSKGVSASNLFISSLVQDMLNNGIPSSCIDTCIAITLCTPATHTVAMMEQGRFNSAGQNLLTTVSIPDGNYTNSQLADELTFQSNNTPPLNIISYPQFKDTFMNTRDISVLFNEPGDTFYSKTGRRLVKPTKNDIMNTYYTQQHIDGFVTITDQIAFVAYYFPVLKELIATGLAKPFLQSDIPYDEIASRVSGIFEGLDSPFYYQVCSQYQNALDTFRQHLTFEMRSINNYTWKYNDNQFTTIHNQLHSSIQRDIGKNYQNMLNRELCLASLNCGSFTTLKNNAIGYSAIYKHLETNLSSVLGQYALVSNYRYTGTHLTNESTFTADGLHADFDFTSMFAMRSSIGGIYGNYSGIVMNFRNFQDYDSTLSAYYTIVQSTNATINTIHQSIAMNHHEYVSTKYASVLPQKMIDTRAYTANQSLPVSFVTSANAYIPGMMPITIAADIVPVDTSCSTICCNYIGNLLSKWYANIPVNTVIGTLSYQLGLVNIVPNQYNIVSTILSYTSSSVYNFLMQINDEQGFNNMDIAMDEKYSVGNDTTGQIKLIAAKILMSNIGDSGISQTLIQNPSIFENTLGKLDRLNIKIYYDDPAITPAWLYLPFQYDVNEWDATFQIDEEVGFINQNAAWSNVPSIPIPKDPKETPYIYFTKEVKK